MKASILRGVTALVLALSAAACGQDAEVGNSDPGGMGAGRPEGANTAESEAEDILTTVNQPGHQDTTEAGAASSQGAIRDTAHSTSTPQRPGTSPDSINQSGERRRRP